MRNEINLLKQSMIISKSREDFFKLLKNVISLSENTKADSFTNLLTIEKHIEELTNRDNELKNSLKAYLLC